MRASTASTRMSQRPRRLNALIRMKTMFPTRPQVRNPTRPQGLTREIPSSPLLPPPPSRRQEPSVMEHPDRISSDIMRRQPSRAEHRRNKREEIMIEKEEKQRNRNNSTGMGAIMRELREN
uniref:Uncharacterized protein n=1 Tax=Cacopsylla melanoneura TaxID=428564 RepID=A0A8D8LQY9_9HEMI